MSSKKSDSSSDNISDDESATPFPKNIMDGSLKIKTSQIPRAPSSNKNPACSCPNKSCVTHLTTNSDGSYALPDYINFKIEFPIKELFYKTMSAGSSGYRDVNDLALLPYQSRDLHNKMKLPKHYREKLHQGTRERKLRLYANHNNTEMVEKSLLDQTDPNATDLKKRTALHISAAKGYKDVVQLLLQHGANPNQKDNNGNTPLHLAACTSHFDVITILLKAGTNIVECDNAGYSPLHLARSRLQMLKHNKKSSSDELKDQVTQIVQMMQIYLERSGSSLETDLLDAFSSKLSISTCRQDVEDNLDTLLNSLKKLKLTEK